MSNEDLEKMTDEELDEAIAKEYGEDWDPANFEKGDPLADCLLYTSPSPRD